MRVALLFASSLFVSAIGGAVAADRAPMRLNPTQLDGVTGGQNEALYPADAAFMPGTNPGGYFGPPPPSTGGTGLAPVTLLGVPSLNPLFGFGVFGGSDDVSVSQSSSTSTNP
jgi:hypothetical protein